LGHFVKAKAQIIMILMMGINRKNTSFLSNPAFSKILDPNQSVKRIKIGKRTKKKRVIIICSYWFFWLDQGIKANCRKISNNPNPGRKTKALHNGLKPAFWYIRAVGTRINSPVMMIWKISEIGSIFRS